MSDLVDAYCRTIHREFRTLFAVWPIGSDVKVGDYGILVGGFLFRRLGHLSDLGIDIEVREDPVQESHEYSSGVSMEVTADAGVDASATPASASVLVELKFSRKEAVAFTATNAKFEHMRDALRIGDRILERFKAGEWHPDHVVVHQRLIAEKGMVLVSEDAGGLVRFRATGVPSPSLQLADFTSGVQFQKAEKVGLRAVMEQGSVPLIGLSGIQRRFFRGPRFAERSVTPVPVNPTGAARVPGGEAEDEDPSNYTFAQLVSERL